jgi:putative endonuclease
MALRRTRREVGTLGERLAEEHLARAGYRVLDRNWRTRNGELDLVAFDRGCIVFCEVRARVATSGRGPGPLGPLESIGPGKRHRLRRLAREWLATRADSSDPGPAAGSLRFDAVGVTLLPDGSLLALEHLRNAF